MRDNLAVIGMDISLPGCEGLATFGHLLYRGLPLDGNPEFLAAFSLTPGGTMLRAVEDASVTSEQIVIITLITNPG